MGTHRIRLVTHAYDGYIRETTLNATVCQNGISPKAAMNHLRPEYALRGHGDPDQPDRHGQMQFLAIPPRRRPPCFRINRGMRAFAFALGLFVPDTATRFHGRAVYHHGASVMGPRREYCHQMPPETSDQTRQYWRHAASRRSYVRQLGNRLCSYKSGRTC
jgi:hypothetical protein